MNFPCKLDIPRNVDIEKFGTTNIMEEIDFTVGATDTAESFTVTKTIDNNPLVD